MSIYLSVSSARVGSPDCHFVGLQNYTRLFADPTFWQTVRNSFVFTIGSELIRLDHRPAAGLRPEPLVQGQAHRAGDHPDPVRHPDRAVVARLEVDVRLALQRHQLDADARAHHRLPVAVAGRARAGDVVGHHHERVARLPVLGGHPARRADRGTPGGHRGGQDRRGRARCAGSTTWSCRSCGRSSSSACSTRWCSRSPTSRRCGCSPRAAPTTPPTCSAPMPTTSASTRATSGMGAAITLFIFPFLALIVILMLRFLRRE